MTLNATNKNEQLDWSDLPPVRACAAKWLNGRVHRAQHGDILRDFEGAPAVELYGELIDAINYAEQCLIEAGDPLAEPFCSIAADLMEMAQVLHERIVLQLRRKEAGVA